MPQYLSKSAALLLSVIAVLIVGLIDFLTGNEIKVFPLYFLPIVIAGKYLGKNESLFFALFSAVVWITTMLIGDGEYSHSYVWFINFFAQFTTFLIVALMYSRLAESLKEEQIISRTDKLTGLLNRSSFYEQSHALLNLCQRNDHSFTLAYIDLDNFKSANDTHGHLHGDELLIQVANVVKEHIRSSDIVARMGGDEFALFLPQLPAIGARSVLEKIRNSLEQNPELKKCLITASIGAISCVQKPCDIDQLIKSADKLMYKVKKTGKNHVLVEEL